jgi:7-cyano-7-deazaguanine synthase
MQKVIILLSGGLDSTVLLSSLLNEGREVEAVSFTYGSKHNPFENQSAKDIANYYNIPLREMDISEIMKGFDSHLLANGGILPEGHYNDLNMKKTVVPGRNLIFLSILAGLAESLSIPQIAIGVHQGDHFIYPDCRPEFIHTIDYAINLSSEQKVKVISPFLNLTKADIVKIGIELKAPFHLTRTCYSDKEEACGKCGSCRERLEAFELNNFTDPVNYAK